MKPSHGNTARAATVLVAILAAACTNKKEIRTARQSLYDADFAVVYSAAVEAVRRLYPTFDDNASTGVIKTAWHQVKFSDPGADDPKNSQVADRAAGVGVASPTAGGSGLGTSASLARRMFFIRFNVVVAGVRPWHVRVVGSASQMNPGDALPTEMRGEATPHWLAGRTDELVVNIYRRLKQHAVPMPIEAPPEEAKPETVTLAGDMPEPARAIAADVVRALHKRDYAALRLHVATDVTWSRAAAPGVDVAMAMWQADPTVLTALEAAITSGCGGDGVDVVCPATPTPGKARAHLGQRGGVWKLTSFVED